MTKDLLNEAIPIIDGKSKSFSEQKFICKKVGKKIGIAPYKIYKYKDMIHYYGEGWGEDSISNSNSDVKFKDRVSPVFRRLLLIVDILRAVDDVQLLNKYLEDMKQYGINISISNNYPHLSEDVKKYINKQVSDMCTLQTDICQKSDELTDMGEEAEADNICPKSKFKSLAESYYNIKQNNKKDKVINKLNKTFDKNLFVNKGIQTVINK